MSKQKDDLEVFEERCNFIENQVHMKDPSLAKQTTSRFLKDKVEMRILTN